MKIIPSLVFSAAVMTIAVAPATAQGPKDFYTLGVHMGFASFRASMAAGEKEKSVLTVNLLYAEASLNDAYQLLPVVNGQLYSLYALDANSLWNVLKITHDYNSITNASIENLKQYAQLVMTNTNSVRDAYSGKLAGIPNRPEFGHSYILGINLAIAEGQATVGEAARTVVVTALNNARNEAAGINRTYTIHGLDLAPLNEAISMASGTTTMAEVYTRIISIRNVFQSAFESLK